MKSSGLETGGFVECLYKRQHKFCLFVLSVGGQEGGGGDRNNPFANMGKIHFCICKSPKLKWEGPGNNAALK